MIDCQQEPYLPDQRAAPTEIIFSVEEAPEGGYTAHSLGFSIVTEADTWEELKEMVRDALRCAFDENRSYSLLTATTDPDR
jgi:hypothetical protein